MFSTPPLTLTVSAAVMLRTEVVPVLNVTPAMPRSGMQTWSVAIGSRSALVVVSRQFAATCQDVPMPEGPPS